MRTPNAIRTTLEYQWFDTLGTIWARTPENFARTTSTFSPLVLINADGPDTVYTK